MTTRCSAWTGRVEGVAPVILLIEVVKSIRCWMGAVKDRDSSLV